MPDITANFDLHNLKESNDFLNSVLENINSAIFIVDKQVRIYSMNNSCKIIFNKSAEKMIGELCGNALGCIFTIEYNKECGDTPHCGECSLRNSIIKAFTEKIPSYKQILERKFVMANIPVYKTFEFSAKYITYNGEEMVLIIVDDITENARQRKYLQEINEEKNKLLAMAAHDLRSPISIIQMYSSFIIDDFIKEKNYDKILNYMKVIKDKSNFMLHLLQETLNISKIEAGILKLNITKFDYINFIKNIIDLNNIPANKKKIKLLFESKFTELSVEWDMDKTEEILNNLISNAIKYSYPETSVKISVSKKDNDILTEVIDEGQGIPEHEIESLFKPFQKTSVKTTAGEISTGLGLAIVKKIVESHKGKVGVTSKEGKGSNFYFTLSQIVDI